jgi:hypothetical protein
MSRTPIYDGLVTGAVQAFVVSALERGYVLRRPSAWSAASAFYPHAARPCHSDEN